MVDIEMSASRTALRPLMPLGIGFAISTVLLALLLAAAVFAPLVAPYDPMAMAPQDRLLPPSVEHPFGTDGLGRDVLSRVLYGGRVSLIVGFSVAALTTVFGLVFGMIAGFSRLLDPLLMRLMDGLMAIPGILLAIALMSLSKPGLLPVIVAIAIPEIPRMARLARSAVLTIREQAYIEAAISIGTRWHRLLLFHVLPNCFSLLIVQATFVCASAILFEAYLSFLGAGVSPEIPSWGNIIAQGRNFVQIAFWVVFWPALVLGLTVLVVNVVGDGLRDMFDPRTSRRRP
ncbi:MAG: ABC transporter permease [Mesorhizobium sp.]|uniref:ABC transporter permease n=1 Tax=Mesorhizobium sp. TaxID=1871066 RepID=UPI000FE85124|nr:ABC transporter permease [Mesorhizobium sp.]RWI54722.1 MAG: ABC transporter permease [Mesorhizobium sp.]